MRAAPKLLSVVPEFHMRMRITVRGQARNSTGSCAPCWEGVAVVASLIDLAATHPSPLGLEDKVRGVFSLGCPSNPSPTSSVSGLTALAECFLAVLPLPVFLATGLDTLRIDLGILKPRV